MDVQLKTLNGYAFNASALGGKEATDYLLHEDALTLEEIAAAENLSGKIPNADSAKLVDITNEITISDVTYGTYVAHEAYRCGRVVSIEFTVKPSGGVSAGEIAVMLKIDKYHPVVRVTSGVGYGSRYYYVRLTVGGYLIIEPTAIASSLSTDQFIVGLTYITAQN